MQAYVGLRCRECISYSWYNNPQAILRGNNTWYVGHMNNFSALLCENLFIPNARSGPLNVVSYTAQPVTTVWRRVSCVSTFEVMIPHGLLLLQASPSFFPEEA